MQAVLGFYLSFTPLRSLVSEAYLLKLIALVIGGEVITEQSKLTQSYLAHGGQAQYHRYRPRRYAKALRSSCLMMAVIARVLTTNNFRASYQGRGRSEVDLEDTKSLKEAFTGLSDVFRLTNHAN